MKMLLNGRQMLASTRPIPIIHCADQAEASIRDVASHVGVDLSNPKIAQAMLLGLHYFASASIAQFPDQESKVATMFNLMLMGMWPYIEADSIIGGGE